MTKELEKAIRHIKTRADAWAVKEVTEALQSISERLDKALSQEPTDENLHREREQAYMRGYEDASKRFRQEPCDDAISREDRLLDLANAIESDDSGYWTNKRISSALRKLPPVTHKSGKWIDKDVRKEEYVLIGKCSVCGQVRVKDKFCSNCGAKMVEPQESEDKE